MIEHKNAWYGKFKNSRLFPYLMDHLHVTVYVTDVLITLTGEIQGRMSSLMEQEKVSREQCIALRSTVSALESRLAAVTKEAAQYKTELELQQARCNQLQQAKDRYVQARYRLKFMCM